MGGMHRPIRVIVSVFRLHAVKNKIFLISLTLLILTIIVITKQILKPVDVTKAFIVMSVEIASHNLPLVMTWCCLIFTTLRKSCLEMFKKEVRLLEMKIESMGHPVDTHRTAKLRRFLVGLIVFKIGVQHIPFLAKGFPWNEIDYLEYIAHNVPILILHTFLFQWILHVNFLYTLFRTLNTILRTIQQQQQNWMAQDFRRVRKSTHQNKILHSCGTVYDALCLQTEKINSVFAPQILSIIPTIFIVATFNSSQTFKMINELTVLDYFWVIFDFLYFEGLFELVIPCVLLQEESEKFGEILLKINDSDVVLLQSYHQKVAFSICGIFSLDGPLIYTVLGALTTNLVILLQFD